MKTNKVITAQAIDVPNDVRAVAVCIATLYACSSYTHENRRIMALQAIAAYFGFDLIARRAQTSMLVVEP